jgi:penicillin-binding protein 1A
MEESSAMPLPTPQERPHREGRNRRLGAVLGPILIFCFFAASGFLVGSVRWLQHDLPPPSALREFRTPLVTRVYDANGELITEFFVEKRVPVPLSSVSPDFVDAILAVEDRRFKQHWGIDLSGVIRATLRDLRARRRAEGGSTITQQLARNVFLTPEKTWPRKLKEALLALRIERLYSKDEILELYLNQICFGHGAYGVEAASQLFFGKHADELTLAESALLAGIPRRPARYSPFDHPDAALARRDVVLKAMVETGCLAADEAEAAAHEQLTVRAPERAPNEAPYFIEEIRRQIEGRYGPDFIYHEGVSIHTTLDLNLQRIANRVLEQGLVTLEAIYDLEEARDTETDSLRSGPPTYLQGALVCIDPRTGAVRAMVGGRDFQASQFNRATQARRQPGSAFKPFVYTAAIDNGFTPADMILDSPIVVETPEDIWRPANYDERFLGPTDIRTGLALSRNLMAVRLLRQVGTRTVISYARRMGIKSPLEDVLSLALGSCGVNLIEITSAYGVFANGGVRAEPFLISQIHDQDGTPIFGAQPWEEVALTPQTTCVMVSMLESVVDAGTARRTRALGFTLPAGGKTGTTNDFTDAWFIGFTPSLVCGVWVGFDELRPIADGASGAVAALPVWAAFMKEATEGEPPLEFPEPPGIVRRVICVETGLLATDACPEQREDIFIAGTEPTVPCDLHRLRIIHLLDRTDDFERLDRRSLVDDPFGL